MSLLFKRIVSFARKRSNNPKKESEVLSQLLPSFSAIVSEDGGVLEKLSDVFSQDGNQNNFKSYVLEIGFGSGENILERAINNPDVGFIGCEVFTGGVVKLLESIDENQVKNIRIWHDDALELIARLPLDSLKLVYILHPDPWPKQKHKKRRLINAEFLKLITSKIMPNGDLLIITDHKDYAKHINQTVKEVEDILIRKHSNYPEITKTKYRLKAEAIGMDSEYFYLVKK